MDGAPTAAALRAASVRWWSSARSATASADAATTTFQLRFASAASGGDNEDKEKLERSIRAKLLQLNAEVAELCGNGDEDGAHRKLAFELLGDDEMARTFAKHHQDLELSAIAKAMDRCYYTNPRQCAITLEDLNDNTVATPDRRCYDNASIRAAIQRNPRDPITRQPLKVKDLVPVRMNTLRGPDGEEYTHYTDATVNKLLQAAWQGDVEGVRYCIASGVDPNANDDHDQRAIEVACFYGQLEVVKALLEAKADPRVGHHMSPIVQAATTGNDHVVRALLAAGINPDEEDSDGIAAINNASLSGKTEAVEALLNAKADPSRARQKGGSVPPIVSAAIGGHAGIVRALLAARAHPEEDSFTGDAAINVASQRGRGEVVEALLEAKADPSRRAGRRGTPPIVAAAGAKRWKHGHWRAVRALLRAKADPSESDFRGITAIKAAANSGNAGTEQLLMRRSAR